MKKYYKVKQGSWIGNDYVQPIFPVTNESIDTMLKTGIATEVVTPVSSWGSGIYTKEGEEWICVSSDWDTSG